ncbi:M12 family metallopeptidase [Shewanella maritima]|uniref:M12 family metallopeptidase n=1 Tax=Shewanella maritima TaxID=2520507 RepID=UPI00373597EA
MALALALAFSATANESEYFYESISNHSALESGQGVIIDPWSTEIDVTYYNVDGLAVMEGDIILGDFNEIKERDKGARANVILTVSKLWPLNTMVYQFDANIDSRSRAHFISAMDNMKNTTFVNFVERTTANQSQYKNYVYVTSNTTRCSSQLGMVGGKQTLNLAYNCGVATATHEIAHALGIGHEHTRSDRDSHINVYLSNVQSGFEHNFNKSGSDFAPYSAYDFNSIMHYHSYAFAKDQSSPTMLRNNGGQIGFNSVLSQGDIEGINSLYPDNTCTAGATETRTLRCQSGQITCETGQERRQCTSDGIWGEWEIVNSPICINFGQHCP